VLGPQWTGSGAGAGNRGTGAGTAQLTRLQGIWVNANAITGYNGLSSYSIPANQCTYVGSIAIDTAAGQVSAYRTFGQNRKFGVWNAYNRQTIVMVGGDPTASWTGITAAWGPSNANIANAIGAFTGLAEEPVEVTFRQNVLVAFPSLTTTANIGIGINASNAPTATVGSAGGLSNVGSTLNITTSPSSLAQIQPTLGRTNFFMLEQVPVGTPSQATFFGGAANMLMRVTYRG
jgi:hypothetical protein